MKVGILHVTRMKVTPEQHELLTSTSGEVITKYAEKAFSTNVNNEEIKNFFINSGNDWMQMREIIQEINSKKLDIFLLWMTPGVAKMPHFSKDLVSFVIENSQRAPVANLFKRDNHMSFLSHGISPAKYGTKVSIPDKANI